MNYGGVLPRTGIVHGGRVKLRHLAERFPESDQFNLLYLVSSATPPHAIDLVRWARKRGAKLVWNQNGVGFPAWAGASYRQLNRSMATLFREADFVVYQSAFCQQSAERFLGLVPAKSTILFNPVDLQLFHPSEQPPTFDRWQLLTAGTHHQANRVIGAMEALRHLLDAGHDARLTVAGELRWARAGAEVRASTERLRLASAVEFVPPFTQSEAPALYRAAHVLLHAKYHDPCPTVPIEAMASGVPVVGSRSGGMPELIGDEGGELIDVPLSWDVASTPEPRAMASAVQRIMSDWRSRSLQARSRAERLFAKEHWVNRHEEIFNHLIAG